MPIIANQPISPAERAYLLLIAHAHASRADMSMAALVATPTGKGRGAALYAHGHALAVRLDQLDAARDWDDMAEAETEPALQQAARFLANEYRAKAAELAERMELLMPSKRRRRLH
jgi:hypothetical protein